MARPLNPRQLKFVELYLSGLSATEAYVKAGYKAEGKVAGNNASRLLENEGIKEAIDAARRKANARREITADWYAERVHLEATREGEGSSHAARVAALKLAGQLLGVATENYRHEHSGPGGGPIPVKGQHEHRFTLSAADLDAVERLAPVAGQDLRPDGGPEPVHPAPAVAAAASVSAAL